ncbi:BglII/BstYI family type II restriction endonuclease [Cohnella thermotolerans]|uniref:BglII/BstYI family type II restriction endonuclease n=1 Tax=Cohnella thermotolerans TaxID=329858 RepID=UPI000550A425|nr:BglII/BstYI family type II restriction endonuclease [Cohnella thermotolerans]
MPMVYLPDEIRELYEVHNFRHAEELLGTSCQSEFSELIEALLNFRLTTDDLLIGGGNESPIPKRFSALLRPVGWYETRIKGDLLVKKTVHGETIETHDFVIEDFLDGHKVDYVKNRVAFDLEWNSKDQTFDRDLYAFRAFHEAGIISAGVLVTRSQSLDEVFADLGIKQKYGASTTWMGKLLYRLKAGRNGGCPVLALGITPRLIRDWSK